ncbi:MAG TPA: phage tail protein [Pyrinomonadaceae bacterium]|jgi:phage tail-like protein
MKQDEIKNFLPAVFQRTARAGNPLAAMLDLMEMLHAPAEKILEDVDRFFDARRAPDEFVPFLAHWVNLDRIFFSPDIDLDSPLMPKIGHLRELVAGATYLSQWRGTKKGLLLFLQTATGVKNFEIDERVKDSGEQTRPLNVRGFKIDGRVEDAERQIRPFHLKIRAPETLRAQEALIRRIIESEKPVHLTYELEFF